MRIRRTMRKRPWWGMPLLFCSATVVLAGVLIGIGRYNRSVGKVKPGPPDTKTGMIRKTARGGVSGAEVKAHLSMLTEGWGKLTTISGDKESAAMRHLTTVIVATVSLLEGAAGEEEMPEAGYLVYPFCMDMTRRRITVKGEEYVLTGMNYGDVLSDNVLKAVSAEGGGLYTLCGFMEEDQVWENPQNGGETGAVVIKRKFHPWKPEAMPIRDDDWFFREIIYGPDMAEIGVFYYPLSS